MPGYPPPGPVPTGYPQPRGYAPAAGKKRSAACSLLVIVTFGIYWYVWAFKTAKEIKNESGIGVGGGVMLLLALIVDFVTPFLIGGNVREMRERAGLPRTVSGPTAFWMLIPLFGFFIWFAKVQGALNEYWTSRGVA